MDTNFIFKYSSCYWLEHEKIKFVSTSGRVIFCLIYRHWWNTHSWEFLCHTVPFSLCWNFFHFNQIINFAICHQSKPSINPFGLLATENMSKFGSWFENSIYFFQDNWFGNENGKINTRDVQMIISYWLDWSSHDKRDIITLWKIKIVLYLH